ncbi:putative colanic acid biosynthesis acetyltransferase WcaF [Williamsia maris]|uniref:Colanic acid biosynthesis acetyltransferase WcaF n=2 Tax=Williamsia maris TaxID=72806 RepID=A0ABT1HIT2_9NOCA|nr:putative colanic acid biosynthesis acetyltransferase [Williamsia maris]MCP2177834.1 putative colanic acid biosynthesis acetyltransferase WcaF [Williamsia maris]
MTHRNLAEFSGRGYDKGRGILTQILWMAASGPISRWWCPVAVRVRVLRLFGANIGEDVIIRHRVRIHWPWKLQIGDRSWVGEGAWILNLEPVTMGADVCVSQDVLLCTGSHDRHSPTFEFDNAPITVRDGAWIAVRATVLRGVTVGRSSVVGATALVVSDVADGQIVRAPVAHP